MLLKLKDIAMRGKIESAEKMVSKSKTGIAVEECKVQHFIETDNFAFHYEYARA